MDSLDQYPILAQNAKDGRWRRVRHLLFLIAWLSLGVYLFWQDRFSLFFPFLTVPFWWSLGIFWACFLVVKPRVWIVVIVPILTVAMCFPTWAISSRFTDWEQKQTLNEFIITAKNGNVPAHLSYSGEPLTTMQADFSQDYTIFASDYLLGGYDYWVRFSTGAKYHFSMFHDGGNLWHISAFDYIGEP